MAFSVIEEIKKQGALLGTVGAVGGFISDVLQPIAPVSYYVFLVSAVATCLLIFSFVIMKARRRKLFHAILLTGAFALFSGILVGMSSEETQAKGVVASKIPAIAQLQKSMGILQKDIADIKKQTKETAETVKKIEKTSKETAEATKQVAETSERIAQSLEAIQKDFSKLSSQGGIIADPKQPSEFYHNARMYEQKGDYLNARKAYNRFFVFKLAYLDPHLRYQTFLKVQEGRAGAREIYGALYEMDQQPVVDFARILLFSPPQRTEMIKGFIAKNKDFAPAYYMLSKDYSKAVKGVQSLKDKQEELKALEQFMALNEQGKFLKYFIDKSLAAKWISEAETRLKGLEAVKRVAGDQPVKLDAIRHGAGWNVTLIMKEKAKEIFYKTGEDAEFKSTGFLQNRDQSTGFKIPQTYFQMSPKAKAGPVLVKYQDIGGEMRGPYSLQFDPQAALFASQKKMLDLTKNSWVSYRDFDGKLLVYFTHLVSYSCAVKEVRYSVGDTEAWKVFPIPPCDADKPLVVPSDSKVYMTVPRDTKSMQVQVTYHDGSKSELRTYEK